MKPNKRIKTAVVVGARPNFVKAAPLLHAFAQGRRFEVYLIHTGQHYDPEMSDIFFRDLRLKPPDINLGVASGSHAEQTGEILKRLGRVLELWRPELVVVVGDVNSTLAGALAARKLNLPLAHVEAGLRSFDRTMPEEINRLLTDAISDYLFTTEESGRRNLLREGIRGEQIFFVGNIMVDALEMFAPVARRSDILARLGFSRNGHRQQIAPYAVLTLHRAATVDDRTSLARVLEGVTRLAPRIPTVFPVHPRTRVRLQEFRMEEAVTGLRLLEPLGYLDFLRALKSARLVLTDSGGIQAEAAVLGVPCLTLRDRTEHLATLECGANTLVGTDPQRIVSVAAGMLARDPARPERPPLWDGQTARRIVNVLQENLT